MKKVALSLMIVFLVVGLSAYGFAWSLMEAARPYKGVTLHVSLMGGYEINTTLQKLSPEFTEQTGIKVVYDVVPYEETLEKHMILLATGTQAYDLLNIDNLWFGQYVGFLRPINDFMADAKLTAPDFDYEDFVPMMRTIYQWGEGEIYTFPEMYFFPVLMYRKDLLAKAGLAPPNSTQEFYDWAAKLTRDTDGDGKTDIYGATIQGRRTGVFDEILNWYWGAGGQVFDEYLHPVFNNDQFLQKLTIWCDLYKNGYAPPGATDYELGEAAAWFYQGNAAMGWNWSFTATWIENPELSKIAGKVGYMRWPKEDPSVQKYLREASTAMCLPKIARHKEAAYLLMQWFTSKEIQRRIQSEFKGASPPRFSVLKEFIDQYPTFRTHLDAAEKGQVRMVPKIVEWSEVDDLSALEFQRAMIGDISPKKALENAVKQVERMLKDKGYYIGDKKYPPLFTGRYQ